MNLDFLYLGGSSTTGEWGDRDYFKGENPASRDVSLGTRGRNQSPEKQQYGGEDSSWGTTVTGQTEDSGRWGREDSSFYSMYRYMYLGKNFLVVIMLEIARKWVHFCNEEFDKH